MRGEAVVVHHRVQQRREQRAAEEDRQREHGRAVDPVELRQARPQEGESGPDVAPERRERGGEHHKPGERDGRGCDGTDRREPLGERDDRDHHGRKRQERRLTDGSAGPEEPEEHDRPDCGGCYRHRSLPPEMKCAMYAAASRAPGDASTLKEKAWTSSCMPRISGRTAIMTVPVLATCPVAIESAQW